MCMHKLTCEKMENKCFQPFNGCNDVIVLSSDENQDEEDKERLIKVGRQFEFCAFDGM